MTLTKADLMQQVYDQHEELTRAQAADLVEAFLRISKDSLISGSDLLLSGFGKFNVKDKKPRRGRNPRTGEDLILDARPIKPASKKLTIGSLKNFLSRVNRSPHKRMR